MSGGRQPSPDAPSGTSSTWVFNDLLWALTVLRTETKFPTTAALLNLQGGYTSEWNVVAAGALIAAIPTTNVFFAFQKHFVDMNRPSGQCRRGPLTGGSQRCDADEVVSSLATGRHRAAAIVTLVTLAAIALGVAGVDFLPHIGGGPAVPSVSVRDARLVTHLAPLAASGQTAFMALSADGTLGITDRIGRRVLRFDADGNPLQTWGPRLGPDVELSEPAGIATAPGVWYVLDRAQPSILRLDDSGAVQARIDLRSQNTYGPNGLATDARGNLYVADTGGSRILIFGPDGNFVRTVGTPGSQTGQLKQPMSLVSAPDGGLLVSDWENARIERWGPDLQDAQAWSTGHRPVGVAVDPLGRVYTPDADKRSVAVFAPGGEPLTALNVNVKGSELDSPSQLVMNSDGTTLFVLGANGVLKLTLETAALAPTQDSGATLFGQLPGMLIGILIGVGLSLWIGPARLRLRLAAPFAVLSSRRRVVSETASSSSGFRVGFPVAAALTAPRLSEATARRIEWWARSEYLAPGALLLVMLVTRLVSLGTLPDTLNPDEADNIQSALRILHGSPPENGFFGFDWYGEPAFTAYVFALFIKLFGVSQFAARLPTALVSVITLGVFYRLLRRQVSIPASLVATLLLGSQLWYVHLSRMAWNNLHAALFTLTAMLAVLLALDNIEARRFRRACAWIGVCGVVCALTLYGYPAGRVVLPSLLAVLPLALVRHRRDWKLVLGGSFAIGAIAVLLFVPEALYIVAHWDGFNRRIVAVSIFNKPEFQAAPLSVLGNQILANFLGFWVGSFNNMPSHFPPGEPLLDSVTGLLVLGGMIASLVLPHFRSRFETWLWWSVFLVGWFFTEVITDRTPDGARGIGWMPALLFFAAVWVELVIRWEPRRLASLGESRLRTYHRFAMVVVGIGALIVASADFVHYVNWSNLPETRRMRDPYVAASEFAAWSAAIIQQAEQHQGGFPVGEWRVNHPLDSNGEPLVTGTRP